MILVNVQVTENTVAHLHTDPALPPSLVVTDNQSTVWFAPQDCLDGSALAVEFAQRLVTCASAWLAACQDHAAAGDR